MSQIRAATARTVQRLRWNCADKVQSLSLFHSSPKTYPHLRHTFVLTSIRTLKRVMSSIDIQPGFNVNILSALCQKLEKLPAAAKLVSIAKDKMAIKQSLAYESKQDCVEGGLNTRHVMSEHIMRCPCFTQAKRDTGFSDTHWFCPPSVP